MTRRGFTGALAGFGAALGLGLRAANAQGSPTADSPRTIETIHGPVEVPANPERIVAINFPSAVALIEMGVIPVGLPRYLPAFPEGYPDLSDVQRIENEAYELDLETILQLEPDLILGSDWLEPDRQSAPFEKLSLIAPTALFEWQTAAGNWPAEAAGCAEAIGKTAELDAIRTAYEERAATIKETYADILAEITWDILSASETNWYLYGPSSSHGKVAVAAGIRLNAAADQTEGYVEYSFEVFDKLADTGALLLRSAGDATLTTLNTLETFTMLPAVTANRIYQSDFFFPSSYGLSNALLTDIETSLQALAADQTS